MSQWLRWAKNQVNLTNQTPFAKNQGPTRESLASHPFNKEILELPLVIQHELKHSLIWANAWDFQQFGTCMCDQQRLRRACAYAQSDQSLCLSLEYSLIVKLLTEHYLEFLRLIGGCRGSSESTFVKISNCWKSYAAAQLYIPDSGYDLPLFVSMWFIL